MSIVQIKWNVDFRANYNWSVVVTDEVLVIKHRGKVSYGAPESSKVCILIQIFCIWNTDLLYFYTDLLYLKYRFSVLKYSYLMYRFWKMRNFVYGKLNDTFNSQQFGINWYFSSNHFVAQKCTKFTFMEIKWYHATIDSTFQWIRIDH